MNNTIRITWYFYKAFMPWCIISSLACLYYLCSHQFNIPFAIICKLVSYAAILGVQYINFNSTKTYFYFRNAGYSINLLYVYTFGLDFLIFIILISLSTIR
jgi:hypothetical protein